MPVANPHKFTAVLTDIEGTTTSISFVYDTLFPYAKEHIARFLQEEENSSQLQEALCVLRSEYEEERPKGVDFGNGLTYSQYLMAQDRKSTGLKAIQGLIWDKGYHSGSLKGEVFSDVPIAFQSWKEQKIPVHIFSSGSILAQKLLFSYTKHGDLTQYLSGYYDTTTGPKKEASSYAKIAENMKVEAQQVLFLSDVIAELDAARSAGMQTALSIRHGNPEVPDPHPHHTFQSFVEFI